MTERFDMTGLMPGLGEDAGAWMSYAAARAATKERDQFGKGSIDGLMAAETGDMASIPGHIIPCLVLGGILLSRPVPWTAKTAS